MTRVPISFDSAEQIEAFVDTITPFDYDFDLEDTHYTVDARSIQGIYTLDFEETMFILTIHCNDESKTAKIIEALNPFIPDSDK